VFTGERMTAKRSWNWHTVGETETFHWKAIVSLLNKFAFAIASFKQASAEEKRCQGTVPSKVENRETHQTVLLNSSPARFERQHPATG
jgi:hypothetical protein